MTVTKRNIIFLGLVMLLTSAFSQVVSQIDMDDPEFIRERENIRRRENIDPEMIEPEMGEIELNWELRHERIMRRAIRAETELLGAIASDPGNRGRIERLSNNLFNVRLELWNNRTEKIRGDVFRITGIHGLRENVFNLRSSFRELRDNVNGLDKGINGLDKRMAESQGTIQSIKSSTRGRKLKRFDRDMVASKVSGTKVYKTQSNLPHILKDIEDSIKYITNDINTIYRVLEQLSVKANYVPDIPPNPPEPPKPVKPGSFIPEN